MSPTVRTAHRVRAAALALGAAGSLGLAAAPAYAGETATPLGTCTAPTPPNANLERLTVTNPVRVGANGRPGGQVGITIRNRTETYRGGVLDLYLDVIDLTTGRRVGGINRIVSGCSRLTYTLDLATDNASQPLKLQRGKVYALRGSAGFTDWGGTDPTRGLQELFTSPITWFVTN